MRENKKQKIIDFIRKEISSGKLNTNAQIPTESELADKYETSIATAHRAVKYLEDAKIVARIKGKGTFIRDNADVSSLDKLKHEREKKIHIILPVENTLHAHWQEATLHALESTLRNAGYNIFYFEYNDIKGDLEEFDKIIKEIVTTGSSGILISSAQNIYNLLGNNRNTLIQNNIPLYVHNITGEYIPDIICNMVSQDPYSDGVLIGELASRSNYKEVIFLGSHEYSGGRCESPDFWLQTRIRGVSFGLGAENNNINFEVAKTSEHYNVICQRIKEKPNKICIISVNARIAAGFIDFAKENGLYCPSNFELISFDDNPQFLKYNITALAAPFDRIGRTLGQMISNSNSLFQDNHIWIKVPYELKERQTFKIVEDK